MNKTDKVGSSRRDHAFPPGLSPQACRVLAQAQALNPAQRRLLAAALKPTADHVARASAVRDTVMADHLPLAFDAEAAAARRALFASKAWRRDYVPGLDVHVYIVGSPGLQTLALELGGARPLFKLGTAVVGRLDERLARLGRQAYGSLIRSGSSYSAEEGFRRWSPPPRLQLGAPMPLGPVRVSHSSLIVTIPAGVSHGIFESGLNRALKPIALATFADSDPGRAWALKRGIPHHQLVRFSGHAERGHVQAATEICLFRPQTDGPALAALLEELVIGHVGLTPRSAVGPV